LNAVFEAKPKGNLIYGYTENYIKVAVPYEEGTENSLRRVLLLELQNNITVKAKLL